MNCLNKQFKISSFSLSKVRGVTKTLQTLVPRSSLAKPILCLMLQAHGFLAVSLLCSLSRSSAFLTAFKTSYLLYTPGIPCPSCSFQTCLFLRAFAFTVLSAWNTQPPDICMLPNLPRDLAYPTYHKTISTHCHFRFSFLCLFFFIALVTM